MQPPISIVIALSLIAAACGGDGAADPAPANDTSAAQARSFDVSLETPDGLTLGGIVYPAGPAWVVLAHMRPADQTSWTELAELFRGRGYTVLTYDNRGYGKSSGDREPFHLIIDATTALDYAVGQGATGIVFGGASMNGATAMILGATQDFEAIFVLSGVPTFPSAENAIESLPGIEEPLLVIAAEDDPGAASNAEIYRQNLPKSEGIILAEGGHGTRMLQAHPDLGNRIVDWVEAATMG